MNTVCSQCHESANDATCHGWHNEAVAHAIANGGDPDVSPPTHGFVSWHDHENDVWYCHRCGEAHGPGVFEAADDIHPITTKDNA